MRDCQIGRDVFEATVGMRARRERPRRHAAKQRILVVKDEVMIRKAWLGLPFGLSLY